MMANKLGNKDDYYDSNENKISLLTPPPIQRKNLSNYINHMLSMSPSASFDESPPPSPKTSSLGKTNHSLNNAEYRYMGMEINIAGDNGLVLQNRFVPQSSFHPSDDGDLSHGK